MTALSGRIAGLLMVSAALLLPFAIASDSIPLGAPRAGVVSVIPNPDHCSEYVQLAKRIIASLPQAAQNHNFVVICSQDAWNSLLKRAELWGRTNTAFTNEPSRTTYIYAAVLAEGKESSRRVIAHELGHILCHCSNEEEANLKAKRIKRKWERNGFLPTGSMK